MDNMPRGFLGTPLNMFLLGTVARVSIYALRAPQRAQKEFFFSFLVFVLHLGRMFVLIEQVCRALVLQVRGGSSTYLALSAFGTS